MPDREPVLSVAFPNLGMGYMKPEGRWKNTASAETQKGCSETQIVWRIVINKAELLLKHKFGWNLPIW